MPLMTEAISREDWELMEQGKRPKPRPRIERPEPPKPVIENEIKFEDIPLDDFVELEYARRNTLKNPEGSRFIGFDVSMILKSNAQLKRKAGRPPKEEKEEISTEPKILTGWMNEGDFLTLVRMCRKKINPQVINW